MKPTYRIVADGKDITALINDRLLLLRVSDKHGMESDEFELRIDDRDQAVALPGRGGRVEVLLGYEGQPLKRMGAFTVDEVQLSGPTCLWETCNALSAAPFKGKDPLSSFSRRGSEALPVVVRGEAQLDRWWKRSSNRLQALQKLIISES